MSKKTVATQEEGESHLKLVHPAPDSNDPLLLDCEPFFAAYDQLIREIDKVKFEAKSQNRGAVEMRMDGLERVAKRSIGELRDYLKELSRLGYVKAKLDR